MDIEPSFIHSLFIGGVWYIAYRICKSQWTHLHFGDSANYGPQEHLKSSGRTASCVNVGFFTANLLLLFAIFYSLLSKDRYSLGQALQNRLLEFALYFQERLFPAGVTGSPSILFTWKLLFAESINMIPVNTWATCSPTSVLTSMRQREPSSGM